MRVEKRREGLYMQCLARFLFLLENLPGIKLSPDIRDVDGNLAECWKAVNKQHRRDL